MNRWFVALPLGLLSALLLLGPAGRAHAALGDSAADLVYTPVFPCRIIDTRVAGGKLVAGTNRTFDVAGTADFEGQGGTAGGCGIPLGPATAVVLNFVAVAPAGAGHLEAWPFGGTRPTASTLNYAAVAGLNIANGIAVPICDPATTTCTKDLTVRANGSDTHLVADVVGFFRFPGGLPTTRRSEFSFVSVLGTNAVATLTSITFTPGRSGNVVVRATGYCNISATGSTHGIGVGLSASPSSGTVSRTAFMRVQAADAAGTHQFPWAITDYVAVTAGVSATVTLRAQQFSGTSGVNEDCSGTLVVEEVFSAS